MSKGTATVKISCPNEECGEEITVKINWWDEPATWGYYGGSPPDSGWELNQSEVVCEECGTVLNALAIENAVDAQWHEGKMVQDEPDLPFDTIEERDLDR